MSFKILLDDDEEMIRELIKVTLTQDDRFQVLEATNGAEAVAIARREHPHLVILDVRMPEMDGYRVARALRAESLDPRPANLMRTAMGQDADVAQGMEAGAESDPSGRASRPIRGCPDRGPSEGTSRIRGPSTPFGIASVRLDHAKSMRMLSPLSGVGRRRASAACYLLVFLWENSFGAGDGTRARDSLLGKHRTDPADRRQSVVDDPGIPPLAAPRRPVGPAAFAPRGRRISSAGVPAPDRQERGRRNVHPLRTPGGTVDARGQAAALAASSMPSPGEKEA